MGNAQWTPTYDLHATSVDGTPSSSVSLHYRVHLSQSTGEHWNGTSLILSTTATDSLNSGIPEHKALSINPVRAPQAVFRSRGPPSPPSRRSVPAPGAAHQSQEPVYEGVAFVSKSPLAVTYTVEGESTIPSDGDSHKVSVVQLPFEATISRVTVPRQELLAYLQASITTISNSTFTELI